MHNEDEIKARAREIEKYRDLLEDFGISFDQLVQASPKNVEVKKIAYEIATVIGERPSLTFELIEYKALPTHMLVEMGFDEGVMEKHRLYITAITILFLEDFKHLQSFLTI